MEEILTLLTPVTFVLALVLERVFPARPMPKVRGWYIKGFIFFVLNGILGFAMPMLAAMVVGKHAPVNLSGLPVAVGGILAYLVSDLVLYVMHRSLHATTILWRWTHQMHHSAERVDVVGSNYFHPLDSLVLGGSGILGIAVLGFSPDAAALGGFIMFLTTTFQHTNMRTPKWIGYFIQRPEAHSLHHSRGVHAYNYGNFPLWDMILGTYRNPDAFSDKPAGYWDGASTKTFAMLFGRDVATPPETPAPESANVTNGTGSIAA